MIILPVFPQNEREEELLWHEVEGTPFLALQFMTLENEEPIIVTDNEGVAALASQMNLIWRRIARTNTEKEEDFCPPGSSTSIEALNKKGDPSHDCILLIVDYRFYPISKKILQKALKQHHKSGSSVLLSVSPAEENPCQLQKSFVSNSIDVILFDGKNYTLKELCQDTKDPPLAVNEEERINLWVLSRKIPFFDIDIDASIQTYIKKSQRENLKKQIHYNSITDKKKFVSTYVPNFFSLNTAENNFSQKGKYILTKEGNNVILFIDSRLTPNGSTLRVWPIGEDSPKNNNTNKELSSNGPLFSKNYLTPILSFCHHTKPKGIIIATLEPAKSNTAEIFQFLQTEEALWAYDPTKQASVNLITGKKITGRQNFVEVHQPNRAFIISSRKNFNHIDRIIANGEAEGFVWPDNKFIHVKSKFDLFRLKVLMNANTPEQSSPLKNTSGYISEGTLEVNDTTAKQNISLV